MRHLLIFICTLVLLGVMSATANACSCGGPGTPCEGYGSATAVFAGAAVSMRENKRPDPAKREANRDQEEIDVLPRTFRFSVEQPYLGIDGAEIEISTGSGAGDCGYDFKIGQRYLVYAYRYKDQLTTSICTRTKSFERANEDLAFLGNLSSAAAGATIYGQVMRTITAKNDGAAAKNDVAALGPDVVVTIESDRVRREIRLDAEGRYRVSGLPPGKLKITLKLPDTLTTDRPEREVTVADRGCASVVYYVPDNGRVSGRVFDPDGQPVARIMISLIDPGSDPKREYVKLDRTDAEGRFTFSAVSAGRYLIAVNFNRFPNPNDPTLAYPSAFYPGVTDQPNAEVITLGVGEKLTGLDIRVPSRRPASVVTGQVVWADGSPVAGAYLTLKDVTQTEDSSYNGIKADEQGRFTINGYVGQKLVIAGRSDRPYVSTGPRFDPMERTEPIRITLAHSTETVKIVITKIR